MTIVLSISIPINYYCPHNKRVTTAIITRARQSANYSTKCGQIANARYAKHRRAISSLLRVNGGAVRKQNSYKYLFRAAGRDA